MKVKFMNIVMEGLCLAFVFILTWYVLLPIAFFGNTCPYEPNQFIIWTEVAIGIIIIIYEIAIIYMKVRDY